MDWIKEKDLNYSFSELWEIREMAIKLLSKN